MRIALLIIDVQIDFCEGGILPAKDTLSLIKPLNDLIYWSVSKNILCFYIRDWHPPEHCSFIPYGGSWPIHCVQNTEGSQFANGLVIDEDAIIINIESESIICNKSYSAFENTELKQKLLDMNIDKLIVTGIATEYCVKSTIMDALHFGFQVNVLTDLVRPIDIQPSDSAKALKEMESAGAILLTSNDWKNIH
jgi:nicotinamidase-related amidase